MNWLRNHLHCCLPQICQSSKFPKSSWKFDSFRYLHSRLSVIAGLVPFVKLFTNTLRMWKKLRLKHQGIWSQHQSQDSSKYDCLDIYTKISHLLQIWFLPWRFPSNSMHLKRNFRWENCSLWQLYQKPYSPKFLKCFWYWFILVFLF